MRTLITAITLVLASTVGFSQTKQDSVPKPKDSVYMSISMRQARIVYTALQESNLPFNEVSELLNIIMSASNVQTVPKKEAPKK